MISFDDVTDKCFGRRIIERYCTDCNGSAFGRKAIFTGSAVLQLIRQRLLAWQRLALIFIN